MKVQGSKKPPEYLIEPAIGQPGMCTVRLTENAVEVPVSEELGGGTMWEYDEYILTLRDTGGLQIDIPAMLDMYMDTARRQDPDYVEPDVLAKQEIEVALMTAQINTLAVDNATALRWKKYYPEWESIIGQAVDVGYKVQDGDGLYTCIQAHTTQADWAPHSTPSLWTMIDEEHAGTLTDPIPYSGNMALENGKYYSQGGVTYLCTRDTINPVYNDLKDLVGLYVEVA